MSGRHLRVRVNLRDIYPKLSKIARATIKNNNLYLSDDAECDN